MKKLSTEEILLLKSYLEFGFKDNNISYQLSKEDLSKIVMMYQFNYSAVAGLDYFFEELDSFQKAAVLFESVKFMLKGRKNIDEKKAISIAASTAFLSLSDKPLCRYTGVFHDQMTIELEKIDICQFKEKFKEKYQSIKESFQTLKEEDNICKQIYGYSVFFENKYEEIIKLNHLDINQSNKKQRKIKQHQSV